MTKLKYIKKNLGITLERLAEFRRTTIMASTGSSLRLSDSKITNEGVEQVMNMISKLSERK